MFAVQGILAASTTEMRSAAVAGTYPGPGIVPKFSETPGEVRWSATWEHGSYNGDIYGDLSGSPTRISPSSERTGVL